MMRLRKAVAICAAFLFMCGIFMIYLTLDLKAPSRISGIKQEYQDNKWLHFDGHHKTLENNFNKHNSVGTIKETLKQIIPKPNNYSKENNIASFYKKNAASQMVYENSCPIQLEYSPRTDIQMLDMYSHIKFDNPDGGAWKQGWKIEVNENMWNKKHKLKVFVVPHSHNDPGWIKTFKQYYQSQTKPILNNMLEKLGEDIRRKFVWAEISFFAMWWDELDDTSKETVKKYLRNNQLEIVTGGWVMNDEANSHWLSIVYQMTQGHQWLQKNLNYTPISSWSIDPFGMSPTQAILLKELGLQNMLIQRVHYSVKKELAWNKNLEFKWRQIWDGSGRTDMFTHMMPFYSYDVPHTCGPDPKICCQFDFKRLPGHGVHCPWRVSPKPITDENVAERANLLLDQYRKKSRLYKTNVLLVPLGDDFRYDHSTEWDVQYENYQRLFDYINGNLNLHVQAQFGTLTDYFNALHAEKKMDYFSTLSGDFFTYADRDDHYWSGYYTSRPFYKRLDRVLMHYIRAAEIILTQAYLSEKPGHKWIINKEDGLLKPLKSAKDALSLFQHHDGVTGTAKDFVVVDYGTMLWKAVQETQNIIQISANLLLNGPDAEMQNADYIHYQIDDIRHTHDSLDEQLTITIGPELRTKKIVVYNSLPFTRKEVITLLVSTPFVEVLDLSGRRLKCQVTPVFEFGAMMSTSKYQVSFISNVPALGLITYILNALLENEVSAETTYADIKVFNQYGDVQNPPGFSNIFVSPTATDFSIQNAKITASYNKLGLLKAIKLGPSVIPVHLDFAKYGVRESAERSGAYLFLPDGDALPIQIDSPVVKVVQGSIFSSVIVQLPYIHHTVILYNTQGADGLGLEIKNVVDISKTKNFEIVMRLSTNINSSSEFFTDLNGYQILKRRRFKKLPIQANYYPIPNIAYIEDKTTRLTLVTGSPLGCTSLRDGQLEVMLDRRLNQDDNRGLGQGVLDNHPTRHIFRVLLENKNPKCQTTADNHPAGFPSLAAHVSSETLLFPLVKLLRYEDDSITSQPGYTSATMDFGVDITLASLKTGVFLKNKDYIGFIIHRKYLDVCFTDAAQLKQFPLSRGTVNISALISTVKYSKLNQASLSFLFMKNEIDLKGELPICPMDTQAFLLSR